MLLYDPPRAMRTVTVACFSKSSLYFAVAYFELTVNSLSLTVRFNLLSMANEVNEKPQKPRV